MDAVTGDSADVLIVGGGPAGMMAGLLFARAGVRTLVLEKHADFLRDFRGDTVHPSTLDLFDELGLLEALLERPHDEATALHAMMANGQCFTIADFTHLPTARGFIALMPQWDFLDFVSDTAHAYPAFALRMECEATGLVSEGGRVVGVTTATGETLRAKLVIAADGRRSVLRDAAALPIEDLGAPMDVFWFRVSKARDSENRTTGVFAAGKLMALIDRGDYWQCAFIFAKGRAEAIRARGIARFRDDVIAIAPMLGDAINEVASFDQVKLLTVSLDRLTRWHAPGLLAIGDAAHAMSPVGGVGINLAIQDAVATANILAAPFARGENVDALLARVQARRMLPTRIIQAIQRAVQKRIIGRLLEDGPPITQPPLVLCIVDRCPLLQRLPAWLVGVGFRREHIRSPKA
jgi:2-polyprenyl-6-methoxyphenol hydroxylase-like FAD-dependent oxidoreductase